MTNNSVFKKLNDERDVLYVQTVERESLFYPSTGINKPYDNGNDLELDTIPSISEPADLSSYNSTVNVIRAINSQVSRVSYFSYTRALNDDTDVGKYMVYKQMKQLTRPDESEFFIQNGYSIDKFDVIALSREFYKDKVDPKFFSVFIDMVASTPTSTPNNSFSRTNNILGLFPSVDSIQTKMGEKRYLYPTTETGTLYNVSTDELTMSSEDKLDKSVPYGEVYLDSGIIILFTEVIELELPSANTNTAMHYVTGIAGRSQIQLNSVLYYIRMYNDEFNYTTNPTFYEDVDDNIIKEKFRTDPTTFVTTVGLYNDDGELIAVGKVSRPIMKNFEKESIIYAQLSL